jgi:hypothetical protein
MLVLKKAIRIKRISEKIAPKSKKTAALKPLVMLVSISVKNTGPIAKARRNP